MNENLATGLKTKSWNVFCVCWERDSQPSQVSDTNLQGKSQVQD